jgi:hypothetical protein
VTEASGLRALDLALRPRKRRRCAGARREEPATLLTTLFGGGGLCRCGQGVRPAVRRDDRGQVGELLRREREELVARLRASNCWASSASVLSPLMAAIAIFALKAGLWFRRGRLVMGAPRFSAVSRGCPGRC